MQLARFLNGVFKKDGFILENANSQNYIIGTPKSEKPIKLKINKNRAEESTDTQNSEKSIA